MTVGEEKYLRVANKTCKFLLEKSFDGRRFNHQYTGTEHILRGLLCADDGVAAQVLNNLGVTIEDARLRLQNKN